MQHMGTQIYVNMILLSKRKYGGLLDSGSDCERKIPFIKSYLDSKISKSFQHKGKVKTFRFSQAFSEGRAWFRGLMVLCFSGKSSKNYKTHMAQVAKKKVFSVPTIPGCLQAVWCWKVLEVARRQLKSGSRCYKRLLCTRSGTPSPSGHKD